MEILVAGGAGYIGSHTVAALLEQGYQVYVLDNLEKGHREAILDGVQFLEGDLRDVNFLDRVFVQNKIDAVIDFAAYSLVGESVGIPAAYYENNVCGTMNLLNAMVKYQVKNIVFSSTAAVYGEPEHIPILETDKTAPKNPYGETKLSVEKMLKWYSGAYGINYGVLRYFNAAGAHKDGILGEDHNPETHLIPLVLQAALGKRKEITVYGDDYDTKDGTCIRDYIHVTDLAEAHILTLEHICRNNCNKTYNLGSGKGYSVLEIIETARKITQKAIPSAFGARRAGDPAVLVASSDSIVEELAWQRRYTDLDTIIQTAWDWAVNHPNGY